jgi:hypothetical protein
MRILPHHRASKIFTRAEIDHKSTAAVTALSLPETTSVGRSPAHHSPQRPSNNAVMALLAAQVDSPPLKRKRDRVHTPPGVSFARSGTTAGSPFSLPDDRRTPPDITPPRQPVFPAPTDELAAPSASGLQSSSNERYDPAKSYAPPVTKQPVHFWESIYHDRIASTASSPIPLDDPFLAQLLTSTPAAPPVLPTDSRRTGPPPVFLYTNAIEDTLPQAQQFLGHMTCWNVEMGRFFATTPDPHSTNQTNAFANEYSLTPGKLSQKWLKHVGLPATREAAAAFLERNARMDKDATQLPFRPLALNPAFFQSEAFDLYRAGAFITTAALDSPESLSKGFTPYHLLMTLGGLTQPLLPVRGLSAMQLRRLVENFGWLLHISVHDSGLLSTRGDARSSFTEHSPLAWILNQVLLFLHDPLFYQAWSKLGSQHVKYSYGFLRSIAELWDTIVSWATPRLPRLHYFLASPSSVMPDKEIVLLYSELPEHAGENEQFLKVYLAGWLTRFKTRFDSEHLGSHVGATFFRQDPPDYLWLGSHHTPQPPPAQRTPNPRAPDRRQAPGMGHPPQPAGSFPPTGPYVPPARSPGPPAPSRVPAPVPAPVPSQQRPNPSEYNRISVPLFEHFPAGHRHNIVDHLRRAGCSIPSYQPPNAPVPVQYCFAFYTTGCSGRCARLHIDPATSPAPTGVLRESLQPLWNFIHLRGMATSYRPTAAFAQIMRA